MANGDGRTYASQNTVQDQAGQTGQTWEARQQAQREVADQFETVDDPDDVNLERGDGGIGPSQEFLDIAEPREAAYEIDQEITDHDISPDDVQPIEGGGYDLTPERQADIAAHDIDQEIPDHDIGPDDVRPVDDGFGLTPTRQEEIVRQDVADEVSMIDIDPQEDVVIERENGEVVSGGLTSDAESELETAAREEAEWEAKLEADRQFTLATGMNVQPDDFSIWGDEVRPNADILNEWYDQVDQQAREEAAESLSDEYGTEFEPADFEYVGGEVRLEDYARAEFDAEQLSEEIGADIGPGDISYDADNEIQLDESVTVGAVETRPHGVAPGDRVQSEEPEYTGDVFDGYDDPVAELEGSQYSSPSVAQETISDFESADSGGIDIESTIDSVDVDDVTGAVGEFVSDPGEVTQEVGTDVAIGGVQATASVGETAQDAEVNPDLATDLSRGGFLSETPEDTSGLLPGELAGFDISEERLRGAAEWGDDTKASFDENPDVTAIIGDSDAPERALQGAAGMGVDLLNVPQHVLTAEGAAEGVQNTPGAISEYGAGTYAETAGAAGRGAGAGLAAEASGSPLEFGSGMVFGLASGAAAGRATGQIGRAVSDRARTAGATRIETDELASGEVLRNIETEGAEGDRFPGADDPDLYRSDPATAVREQADEYTPTAVDELFSSQGIEEGTTLTKALDVEPEGPGSGRADTGFTSAPDEVGGDFEYETPGSFFGPELSPNFLRADAGEASFSLRPGLPDMGNRPTGVLARTDVENPESDTLMGFNQEIMDRAGESTAYTKPADEVNVGEIEAIVPPGGEFAPVRSGGLGTDLARRAGIGADFYTEVGGRRVPLRTVAATDRTPDADADAGTGGGLFGEGGDAGDAGGESLDYYARAPGEPVDRPLPPSVPGAGETSIEGPEAGVETMADPERGTAVDAETVDYGTTADSDGLSTMGYDGIEADAGSRTGGSGVESDAGIFGESVSGSDVESPERSQPSGGGSSVPPSGGSSVPPGGGYPSEGSPIDSTGFGSPGPGDSPGGGSPFGDSPFGGPAPAAPPGETVPTQPTRPRPWLRPDGPDDEWGLPEDEPVDPVSPEYINPVASGTSNIFGDDIADEFDEDLGGESATADAADRLFGGGSF